MNDRVMTKIKREARRAAKVKTLLCLEKEIGKYKNWVNQNSSKIDDEMASKDIETNVIHNLQLMKLLMNKKIINNDYIYETFEENSEGCSTTISKLDILGGHIEEQYH